jgi:enamine deaminase RidA (YjgF/YER057c/UK114 family)
MPFELLNPAGLESPVGYAHIAKITSGTILHIAGQAPFDCQGQVVGKGDFVAQFAQVVRNLKTKSRLGQFTRKYLVDTSLQ